MGRDKRLEYAASFEICYFFRLLYYAGTQFPIMGALRWEIILADLISHSYKNKKILRVSGSGRSMLCNYTN